MKTERKFKPVDYEAQLAATIKVGDFLPPSHLARFLVRTLSELDLSSFYAKYSRVGGEAYPPRLLLGLLLYSYATGMFSSRKIEKATYESLPHFYLAGGMHPDHDTLNQFRQTFLAEIKAVFVQVLLLAQELGHLKLGDVSIDGSKIQADASKHSAVSYGRLQELAAQFGQEIEALLTVVNQGERQAWPSEFSPEQEIALRESRLARLAEAKTVIEERAAQRYQAEVAAHAIKLAERSEYEQRTGKKLPGPKPQAPTPGAQDKDQYNFTDPESRIMKQGNHDGFEQAYNAQVAVSHESRFIVANTLSNHPSDQNEALPTLAAIPEKLGKPTTAGILLFGRNPQRFLRSAEVICVRYMGDQMDDEFVRQDITGTLAEQIRQAETFVTSNIRRDMKISRLAREETTEYPIPVIREAIVNAVAHRDYSVRGEGIRIVMYNDRMEIYSPGRLPGHVTLDNLKDERFSRNEAIVAVLSDLGYIERLGYGIDRMIGAMQAAGLPAPIFAETTAGFKVTLSAASQSVPSPSPSTQPNPATWLNDRQEQALAYIQQHGRITNSDLQEMVPEVSPETIRRDLADLVDRNLLIRIGAKKATYYILK